jgi:hypothetical protein
LWLKTPSKISEPYNNSFRRKSNSGREKKKEKKTPLIVNSACQPLGPTVSWLIEKQKEQKKLPFDDLKSV